MQIDPPFLVLIFHPLIGRQIGVPQRLFETGGKGGKEIAANGNMSVLGGGKSVLKTYGASSMLRSRCCALAGEIVATASHIAGEYP